MKPSSKKEQTGEKKKRIENALPVFAGVSVSGKSLGKWFAVLP